MKKTNLKIPAIKLVGITTRTSNNLEISPSTAKIGSLVDKYFKNQLSQKILFKKNPHITYCAYTNYSSDENGEYTYFVGHEVEESFGSTAPEGMEILKIPEQKYTKFTTDYGRMPDICIDAWQKIWKMDKKDLGGSRNFLTDFEIYDQRAQNPESSQIDIYIGIS